MDIIDIKKDTNDDVVIKKDPEININNLVWYGTKLERFYTLQIKTDTKEEVLVYTSYGKIGGKTTLNKKSFPNLEKATKFYHKTISTKERDEFRSVSLEDLQERQKRNKIINKGTTIQKEHMDIDKKQERDLFNWGELQEEPYQYSEWKF